MFTNLYGETTEEESRNGFSLEESFIRKWTWYQTFYSVANNDAMKVNEVMDMNVLEFLTALSFKKDLNAVEASKIKRK